VGLALFDTKGTPPISNRSDVEKKVMLAG